MKTFIKLLAVLALSFGSFAAQAQDVLISAAASLKDVLEELAPVCAKDTGVTLRFNLAASGVLARQIIAGAPGEIFISADEATMDTVDKAGLLAPGTRAILAGNVLVFVVPKDSSLKLAKPADLEQAEVRRLGLGDPASVPAGRYAQTYLEKVKVWDAVKGKVVPLDNVRTVLTAVASGNVEAGAVYQTDMFIEPRVRAAWVVTGPDAPTILYPMATLKTARDPAAAAKVRAFLLGETAAKVFAKYGFLPPPAAAPPAR